MAKIDSAYAYYISAYANREVSRYDSHKKSDLRKVYNQIVKTNKESPLFKIRNVEDAKKYAIDIKESAKSIQNVVASLSDQYGSFADSFQKKVAVSSDEDKVDVTYIGDGNENNQADSFEIEVDRLAGPQVNVGNYLKDNTRTFRPGDYSFELNTVSAAYEFQFSISSDETNLDVLQKLSNLINNSNLGITAEIRKDNDGNSALALTSVQTGLAANETSLFTISPDASPGSIETMNLLGIDQITENASNSIFRLNGKEHSSLSNTFSINNAFELKLKGITGKQPASIGFKANTDAIADNIQTLVDAYNGIISTGENYADSSASAGHKLQRDMATLSLRQKSFLEEIGLIVSGNGAIRIDKEALALAVTPEREQDTFSRLSHFRDSIGKKAEAVAIDPMNYVNKVIVTYKNPGHNFATPYITSIYSGMMLDHYV